MLQHPPNPDLVIEVPVARLGVAGAQGLVSPVRLGTRVLARNLSLLCLDQIADRIAAWYGSPVRVDAPRLRGDMAVHAVCETIAAHLSVVSDPGAFRIATLVTSGALLPAHLHASVIAARLAQSKVAWAESPRELAVLAGLTLLLDVVGLGDGELAPDEAPHAAYESLADELVGGDAEGVRDALEKVLVLRSRTELAAATLSMIPIETLLVRRFCEDSGIEWIAPRSEAWCPLWDELGGDCVVEDPLHLAGLSWLRAAFPTSEMLTSILEQGRVRNTYRD